MTATPGRALVGEALRPMLAAVGAVAGVGLLLALSQALGRASVAPGLLGALRMALGLLPSVLSVALPVGLLFGLVTASRAWREGGDWLALAASGVGARAVLPAVVGSGLLAGLFAVGLSHVLEPLGRRDLRQTLTRAAGDIGLQPDSPVAVGDALVVAQAVDGPHLGDVFIVGGQTAVAARSGLLTGGGTLSLRDGSAVAVGPQGQAAWRLEFARAELRLDIVPPRVELAERTDAELAELVARRTAAGGSAMPQALALLRRTALPACLPLLAVLAVPLGARGARPGLAATLTVLLWWSVLRIADQFAASLGASLAAWMPALALVVACGGAWLSWRAR